MKRRAQASDLKEVDDVIIKNVLSGNKLTPTFRPRPKFCPIKDQELSLRRKEGESTNEIQTTCPSLVDKPPSLVDDEPFHPTGDHEEEK